MNTYGTLKTALADWLDREDLVGQIPLFIRMAEDDIYDGLRCHHNEFEAVYSQTEYVLGDNAAVANEVGLYKILPSNFREMRLVTWEDRPLKEVTPQRMAALKFGEGITEVSYFAIKNRTIEMADSIPDDPAEWGESSKLVYWYYGTESLDSMPSYQTATNAVETPPIAGPDQEGNAQTDSNTTRLLQQFPNLYFAAALRHAYDYLQVPAKSAEWFARFNSAKARLQGSSTELTGSTVTVGNAYTDSLRSY